MSKQHACGGRLAIGRASRWFLLAAVTLSVSIFPGGAPAQKGSAARPEFFFKDGDRIVVMGDSITEQRLYSNYLEMWVVTRFPEWKLTFRNVGIGGDTSPGGNGRFARDVLAHKATALTVDFGMNDGGYQPFNPGRYAAYLKGLQGIANQAKKAGIRVAWITPQPVEHNPGAKQEFYNKTLEKFSEGVKEIAGKNNGLFVDQFHPYWAVIQKARDGGVMGRITGGDAVHPGPPGQALMAASILKGLHFPRLVSSVNLKYDPAEKAVRYTSAPNCLIAKVMVKDGTISFERTDHALPFFPEKAESILKWAPLLDKMNYYGLKIGGLSPGRYEIRLAGKKIAEHSAKELGKGVNLAAAALSAGPIANQVKNVWKKVTDKTNYFHDQIFRGVLLAGGKSFKNAGERQAAYEERMKMMPALDEAVRQALIIQPHSVEIVPVKS